jgi:DNA-binding CsgD family transcriptional regulator
LGASAAAAAVGRAVFDALPFPAAILDESLDVTLANTAWRADRIGARFLHRSTAALRSGKYPALAHAIRAGTRRFLSSSATAVGRPLLVVPQPRALMDVGATALVIMGCPHASTANGFTRSAGLLWGLTAAESAVAEGALAGWSLRQVAARRGTTIETVRSQMKSVLRKAGASTRPRLIGMLLQTPWQPSTRR